MATRSAGSGASGSRRSPRHSSWRRPTNRPVAHGGGRPSAARSGAARRPTAAVLAPPPPEARAARPPGAVVLFAAPLLVALAGVVLLALGMPAPGAVLVVAGLAVVLADLVVGSPARVLRRLPTRPVDDASDARLVNLVEGLAVAVGVAMPELRILEDPAVNALLVGTGAEAQLICTRGLLERLDRMQLEAVVAHELAHLRRGDTAAAVFALRSCGALLLVAPRSARLVARLSGDQREALADVAGARYTRYPPALADALNLVATLPTRPERLDPFVARATAGWWFAPLAEAEPPVAVAGRLDLGLRAAAVNEL